MPPNQVLAGLALFLSLFIMGPTVSAMNQQGVQPYLKGDKTQTQAFHDGVAPLRDFMWKTTRTDESPADQAVRPEAAEEQGRRRADHPDPGVHPVRAAGRLHHRLRHLHSVPADRHGGVRVADVAGHDDAASGDRVDAVQAAALRDRQRVGLILTALVASYR